jgi:hypothetical protein
LTEAKKERDLFLNNNNDNKNGRTKQINTQDILDCVIPNQCYSKYLNISRIASRSTSTSIVRIVG